LKKILICLIIVIIPIGYIFRVSSSNKIHNIITEQSSATKKSSITINKEGKTIKDRYVIPTSYEVLPVEENSFGYFLRNLKLKEYGAKVHYYDGRVKRKKVHSSVIDIDVGDRDLQQCADAIMRLRGEYLYSIGEYNKIHFNFTNGFNAEYKKWRKGNRIKVDGNDVSWVKSANYDESYETFRKYMNMVFCYAGTLSLSKELVKAENIKDINIGDVFIQGGSPGHAIIVVDVAINKETNDKLFLLAQSYMPAQSIHILKNPMNKEISPWYSINFDDQLITPEWTFNKNDLMRFE
jgi:hypothetical protein